MFGFPLREIDDFSGHDDILRPWFTSENDHFIMVIMWDIFRGSGDDKVAKFDSVIALFRVFPSMLVQVVSERVTSEILELANSAHEGDLYTPPDFTRMVAGAYSPPVFA